MIYTATDPTGPASAWAVTDLSPEGHAQVRGFLCKIDKRPLRRCRSPKGYRVGVGNRFKVCHPTPYPDCIDPTH